MKRLRLLPNVLFSLLIAISLVFQAPLAAVAAPPASQPHLPPPRPVEPQPAEQSGWVTVASMDFEGSFPGTWLTADNNGSTGGNYTWAPTTARAYAGSKSGWPAAGGSGTPPTTPPTSYPASLNSGVGYGPFSLVGATDARVTFWLYLDSESNKDFVKWQASDNGGQGESWGGDGLSGTTDGQWQQITYDLKNFDGQGTSLLGNPNVMFAITFESDGTNSNYEGAYVDDIVIEKMAAPPACYTLTTSTNPSGAGSISASPATNCTGDNGPGYTAGTVVTLTASANIGFKFKNWSGNASGTSTTAQVTMSANRSVTANYDTVCYTLSTSSNPSGGGSITVDPGPNCGATLYNAGTVVTLTAQPASGYTFANWTGDASGTSTTAQVTMNGNRTAAANFTAAPTCYTLSASPSPSAGGQVSASPEPNCAGGKYTAGTVVTLTATPASGYTFSGWSGDASGTDLQVEVTMNGNRTATASFTASPTCYSLTTSVDPSGGGQVNASPASNCAGGKYTANTVVTLTAEPAEGFNFERWEGASTATNATITVTMSANQSVTARFAQRCYTLTKAVDPSDGGTIETSPAPDCNNGSQYSHGTVVTLTAQPAEGFNFDRWQGASTSTNATITLTMSAARSITATFTQMCHTLATSVSPTGGGTVSRNPASDPDCGSNQYKHGTEVTLTANPASGYTFANWSGGASGSTSPTTVTMDANKSVQATFTQLCYTLTTSADPGPGGSVSASPNPNCSGGRYTPGTKVTLTANPAAGYQFESWSGAVSGTGSPTEVTMDGNKTVTARFTPLCYTLTTSPNPANGGTVTASPGPNCGSQYSHGTQVELHANPASGYLFGSWSGGVTGSANPVTVTMDGTKTITAGFTTQCFTLTTAVDPSGGGQVNASPAPDCNNGSQYTPGKVVTLTAQPAEGYQFDQWSGASTSSEATITLTMSQNRSVTAGFTQQCYTLSTSVSPSGGGSVGVSPAGNCGTNQYKHGTLVTFTAQPASGYTFSAWSGALSGSQTPETLTITANSTVTATFSPVQQCYALTTTIEPSGGGTVTATPTPDCDGGTKYTAGTEVTLKANPASGYSFKEWSGAASGTSTTTKVTMSANRAVTATFAQVCYSLNLTINPSSGGTVSKSPAPDCDGGTKYKPGTRVTLTASPAATYTFTRWSGSASGTGLTAEVTMNGDRSVTATFTQVCYTLTAVADPSNGGSIALNPQPNCDGRYITGTQVTLTASPASGYTFAGWSGASSSTEASITLTMSENRSVKATFNAVPTCYSLGITINPSGGGTVSKSPAPNCEGGTKYTAGSKVTLTSSPAAGYTFSGWSGAASGSAASVEVTMSANRSVTAAFEAVPTCYTLTTTFSPVGSGSVGASPLPNCAGGKYTHGTKVTLTASPSTGYTFASWSGAASGTTSPTQVTMDGDKTVTATFTLKCYTLLTAASPDGSGAVNTSPAPNCAGGKYTHGTVVTVTANASEGYDFTGWSGAASGSSLTAQVTMTAERSVTAEFTVRCYSLTLLAEPAEYGSVEASTSPNCADGKYSHGTQITITATPNQGFVFHAWSGGAGGAAKPTVITITGDTTVTANFSLPTVYLPIFSAPGAPPAAAERKQ